MLKNVCKVQYLSKLHRSILLLYFYFIVIQHYMCVFFSEQLLEIQENVEAIPEESVTEVTEIPETDIAKEEQVEIEIEDATVPPTVSG